MDVIPFRIKSVLTREFCFYFIVLVTLSCFVYAYVESYIHKSLLTRIKYVHLYIYILL